MARLALFYHDPTHADAIVDNIVARAGGRAASYGSRMDVICAAEGLTVSL